MSQVIKSLFKENMTQKEFNECLKKIQVRYSTSHVDYGLIEPIRLKALDNVVETYIKSNYLKSFGYRKTVNPAAAPKAVPTKADSTPKVPPPNPQPKEPAKPAEPRPETGDEEYYYEYDDEGDD